MLFLPLIFIPNHLSRHFPCQIHFRLYYIIACTCRHSVRSLAMFWWHFLPPRSDPGKIRARIQPQTQRRGASMHLLVFDRGATMFSLRRCANITMSGPPPYDSTPSTSPPTSLFRTFELATTSPTRSLPRAYTFTQLLVTEWSRTSPIRISTCWTATDSKENGLEMARILYSRPKATWNGNVTWNEIAQSTTSIPPAE